MKVEDFVEDLEVRGVTLSIGRGEDIQVRSPLGILTAEDRASLIAIKAELLSLLHWRDTLPDVLVIPKDLPNDEASIRDCIDAQRKKSTAA